MIDVTTLGATGNGTTDDRAAIQSAINAASVTNAPDARRGNLVYFPKGTYRITSALTISNSPVSIRGDGSSSIIKIDNTNSTAFSINAAVNEISIAQLKIVHGNASPPASGFAITMNASGILWIVIQDIVFGDPSPSQGVWGMVGCAVTPTPGASVNNVIMTNCIGRKIKGVGVRVQSGIDWVMHDCLVEVDGTGAGTRGLVLDSNSKGFYATNTLFLGGEYALLLQQTLGESPPKQHTFVQVAGDGAGVASWQFNAGRRCRMTNCWAATVQNNAVGVAINNPAEGLVWEGGIALNCGREGFQINGGSKVFIDGAHVISNSLTSPGTFSGIAVGAGVSDFAIRNCQIYNDPDFSGQQKHGIQVSNGSSNNYMIAGNYLLGNADVGLADGGTGPKKAIANNLL
jgi:hypothetical protein